MQPGEELVLEHNKKKTWLICANEAISHTIRKVYQKEC